MSTEEAQTIVIPSMPELCLNVPLFESFPYDKDTAVEVWDLHNYKGHLDCHCIECGQPSIFHIEDSDAWSYTRNNAHTLLGQNNHYYTFTFYCSRNDNHKLIFYFRLHNDTITKIGQYPSLADLATIEIQKYRKVLGDELYREFNRAIGLVSHGVGIGAFVYLRRIFERLIEDAHQKSMPTEGWEEEKYQQSRMDDKIVLLKNSLPGFLVENRTLYSILSKGLHELDESICLNAFPITKVGIELILDEKLEELERAQKIKEASKDIGELHQKLK